MFKGRRMDLSLSPEATAFVKGAATPAAISAVEVLSKKLGNSLALALAKPIREIALNLKTNFGPHLEITFDKCTKIKTLVNLDEPVELTSQYTPLNFECQGIGSQPHSR
jgi:hypothetical protein